MAGGQGGKGGRAGGLGRGKTIVVLWGETLCHAAVCGKFSQLVMERARLHFHRQRVASWSVPALSC